MLPTLLIRKLEAFGPPPDRGRRALKQVAGPDRSKRMLRMMQPTACVVTPTSENRYA